jgi:hypothetical protein
MLTVEFVAKGKITGELPGLSVRVLGVGFGNFSGNLAAFVDSILTRPCELVQPLL